MVIYYYISYYEIACNDATARHGRPIASDSPPPRTDPLICIIYVRDVLYDVIFFPLPIYRANILLQQYIN